MAEADPETIVQLAESTMTLTDNEERQKAHETLTEYEKAFSFDVYFQAILKALLNDELIANHVLHLKICIYAKEYCK